MVQGMLCFLFDTTSISLYFLAFLEMLFAIGCTRLPQERGKESWQRAGCFV